MAGDWYGADDITPEFYFYIPDGAGWWTLTRGQFLFIHDERSKKILDFILIPEKGFSGANFRSLQRATFLKWGCPRRGMKLENGFVFRKSKLVAGKVPWGEVETSLAQRLGIKFEHAKPGNHKGKLAENIGGLFQKRLRGLPGWAGPNEQGYPIEAARRAIADVEAKRKTPWEAGFLSMQEMLAAFESMAVDYNETPQDSTVMGGRGVAVHMSPNVAWRTLAGPEPMVNLRGSGAEHLLTDHFRMVRLTRNGIRFQMGKELYAYAGEATGVALASYGAGDVKFYFDPEAADVAFFETADGKVHTAERQRLLPAHGDTPEDWQHFGDTVTAHNKAIKAAVSNLPVDFLPERRVNAVSPEVAARGGEMERGRAAVETQRRERGDARKIARSMGLPAPASDRTSRAVLALQGMQGTDDEN